MQTLTNVVAWLALAIAIAAFYRTGAMRNLREQIERIGAQTEEVAKSARLVAADALDRVEKFVRGKRNGAPTGDKDGPKPD